MKKNILIQYVLSIVSLILLTGVAFSDGGTGKISGTVNVKIPKFKANTVVYIEALEGDFSAPEQHAVMDQKDITFVPHVLPIVQGTVVDYRNSDDVLHNVHTTDACAQKFNLGTWPKGEIRSYQYNETGCHAVMLCNVHPDMEAFVIVLQNPYFAVTDKNGKFTIDHVPPGTYTLKVWNERYSNTPSQEITVSDGKTVEVTFTLVK